MPPPPRRRLFLRGPVPLALALSLSSAFAGCGSKTDAPASAPGPAAPGATASADAPAKVRIGYLGLTCEAAMFVAREKGFFKEEGLEAEFVKADWDSLRDGLGLGRIDANYHLIMYLLKPIEQGLDVRLTGGIHSGCLRVQAGTKTNIRKVEDLKAKRVGVPTALGTAPFMFACRVLKAHGLDPQKDVEWVVLGADVLGLALDNGQVDAVADSEPIGSILLAGGTARTIADGAVDAPYKDEYCCAAVVSGALAKRSPATAAKVTRAFLKGAKWVQANPGAAARLSVEKKYIAASEELNAHAISHLNYMPGVARCRDSVLQAANDMKEIGLLNPSTDAAELARRAWLDLEGVNDEWIRGLKIEKVSDGGPPAEATARALAALWARDANACSLCCVGCEGPLDIICRTPAPAGPRP